MSIMCNQFNSMSNDASDSTVNISLNKPVRAGDLLVFYINGGPFSLTATGSVTDTAGNVWQSELVFQLYSNYMTRILYAKNTKAATNYSVTYSFSSGNSGQYRRAHLMEFQGVDRTNPVGYYAMTGSTGATTNTDGIKTTNNATLSGSYNIFLAGVQNDTTTITISTGTGQNLLSSLPDSVVEYRVLSTATTGQATWTFSNGSVNYGAFGMELRKTTENLIHIS